MLKAAKKETDKMVIEIASEVPNLITPGSWDGQTLCLNCSIYECLVAIDTETKELSPELATAWDSPDGKAWTLKLRKGMKFHDGTDLRSEDARFTVERTQDPDLGHLKQLDFSVVERVETPDDLTVVLHLSEVRPTFMFLMSDYNMCILSSECDYVNLGESKPMGTGAFMLKEMVPKESALLVRNPDFWGKGLPKACYGRLGDDIFYSESPIMNMLAQHKEIPLRGRYRVAPARGHHR